jgi:hemerythrin
MALIEWNDSYSVGNNTFDAQHKKLFALLDNIFEAMKTGKGKEVIGPVLQELKNYTVTHFSAEERLMEKHNYPDMASHIKQHKAFVDKVADITTKYNAGKMVMTIEISSFLKDWLVNHIQGVDRKYKDFFISKGEK